MSKENDDLLRYLNGEISFEEWIALKRTGPQMGRADASSLLDEEALLGEETAVSEVEITSSNTLLVPLTQPSQPDTAAEKDTAETVTAKDEPVPSTSDVSPDTETPSATQIPMNSETMFNYLSGKMPFSQFELILARELQRQIKLSSEKTADTATSEAQDDTEADKGDEEDGDEEEEGEEEEEEEETEEAEKEQDKGEDAPPADGAEAQEYVRPRRKRKPKSSLPRDLQGLMGEANLKFARGEHEEAIKMCMEVIRLAPKAPKPFQTLGMIYEDLGDTQKSLQYFMIGAYLRPRDVGEWLRIADLFLDQNNINQAITCYSNAIKYDRQNVELVMRRCALYEQQGEPKKVLEGYQQALRLLPEGDRYLQLAKKVAKSFHESGEGKKAVATMEEMMTTYPGLVSVEEVHMAVELCLTQRSYDKAIQVILRFCGVVLELSNGEKIPDDSTKDDLRLIHVSKETPEPEKCHLPEDLPVDITGQLIVCVIHLGFMTLAQKMTSVLFEEDPNVVGDLFLDIAEAYMDFSHHEKAKPILQKLVKSEQYNMAAVWLRYGECLNSLGEIQKAAQAFQHVVEMAPSHLGARVSLSALQQQLGMHEEALRTLQDESEKSEERDSVQDIQLLIPRCYLLHSQGRLRQFIHCAKRLLFGNIKLPPKEHATMAQRNTLKYRMEILRSTGPKTPFDALLKMQAHLNEASVSTDDLFDIYTKLCDALVDLKEFKELEQVAVMALACVNFTTDANKAMQVDFNCLTALILSENGSLAYNFARVFCLKFPENKQVWNLFNQVVALMPDHRHNKFCMRLSVCHPDHEALGILNGNNALAAGTYKHALAEYITIFRQQPDNPLLCLLIGVSFIHLATQKYTTKRHSIILQGCAFLNQYLEKRGECQEAYYNIGRALHQLGLSYAAVHYYEKALALPPVISGPDEELFDLRKEIAFNLSLIYQASDSPELASYIMQQYLVV